MVFLYIPLKPTRKYMYKIYRISSYLALVINIKIDKTNNRILSNFSLVKNIFKCNHLFIYIFNI